MSIDFSLFNIKDFMKYHGVKASDFSYDIEYLGGYYDLISEEGYNVFFGSVTKSSKVSIIEIHQSNTYIHSLFGLKNDVGLEFNAEEFKSCDFNDVTREFSFEDYQIVILVNEKSIISKIEIRNITSVKTNNLSVARISRLNKIIEPDEAHEIRSKLTGTWKFCKNKTESFHGDSLYGGSYSENCVEIFNGTRLFSAYIWDGKISLRNEFEYRISDYKKGVFTISTINIDTGSSCKTRYMFLNEFLINQPGTDMAGVWLQNIVGVTTPQSDVGVTEKSHVELTTSVSRKTDQPQ